MSGSEDIVPKLRPTKSHRHKHTTQTRLPKYLTEHPHAIAAFHTLLVGPPIIAVVVWVGGWYGSPEGVEWGSLRRRGEGGGGRFGGMGWCEGEMSTDCVVSPWYDIPSEYLPSSVPGFVPSLLTLLNVMPAPLVLLWWISRYVPRMISHLRTSYHNHNLPSSSPRRVIRAFEPYPWFSILEPWWINSITCYIILITILSHGMMVWIEADAGVGWSLAVAGHLGFLGWRALKWKYEELVDDAVGWARERFERERVGKGEV